MYLWKIGGVSLFGFSTLMCAAVQYFLKTQTWPGFVLNQFFRIFHIILHYYILVWYTTDQYYCGKLRYVAITNYNSLVRVKDKNN